MKQPVHGLLLFHVKIIAKIEDDSPTNDSFFCSRFVFVFLFTFRVKEHEEHFAGNIEKNPKSSEAQNQIDLKQTSAGIIATTNTLSLRWVQLATNTSPSDGLIIFCILF